MKKNISLFVSFFLIVLWCISPAYLYAEKGDVKYIKWTTNTIVGQKNILLKDSYMVWEIWEKWEYLEVVLTDGKIALIHKNNIYEHSPESIVYGNSGYILLETQLYISPDENTPSLWTLHPNDIFVLKKINIVSEKWLQVTILSWNLMGKTGYISAPQAIITCVSNEKYNIFKDYFSLPTWAFSFFNSPCNIWEEVRIN